MVQLQSAPMKSAAAHLLLNSLTVREREIAAYITDGTPNKIIAAELGISQRTIEAHRARIFMKMRVRNAVQLTQCCLGAAPAADSSAAQASQAPGISAARPGARRCVQ